MPNFDELENHALLLCILLKDRHTGISSWTQAVATEWQSIVEMWEDHNPQKMQDVAAPPYLQISISESGKSVWVNDGERCIFRACRIGKLIVGDERKKESER